MSTIPKFASNKKYWQILNKLVFGDEVSCPRCHKGLHENYCNWWAYDELELLGYAHESWNHSKGCFAGTNQGENIWSVTKRHARKAVRRKNPDETARLSLPRMDGKS